MNEKPWARYVKVRDNSLRVIYLSIKKFGMWELAAFAAIIVGFDYLFRLLVLFRRQLWFWRYGAKGDVREELERGAGSER